MVSSATPRALLDEEVGSLAGRRANWMDVWLRGRVGGSVNGVLGGWVIGSLNGWVGEWSVGWVSEWLAEGAGLTNCNGPSTATPRPARRANYLPPPSSPNTCTATYAASSTSLAKNNTKKTNLKSAAGTIVGSIFLGNPARADASGAVGGPTAGGVGGVGGVISPPYTVLFLSVFSRIRRSRPPSRFKLTELLEYSGCPLLRRDGRSS